MSYYHHNICNRSPFGYPADIFVLTHLATFLIQVSTSVPAKHPVYCLIVVLDMNEEKQENLSILVMLGKCLGFYLIND